MAVYHWLRRRWTKTSMLLGCLEMRDPITNREGSDSLGYDLKSDSGGSAGR